MKGGVKWNDDGGRRGNETERERERESQVVADGLLPEINSFWGRVAMATQVTADRDWLC